MSTGPSARAVLIDEGGEIKVINCCSCCCTSCCCICRSCVCVLLLDSVKCGTRVPLSMTVTALWVNTSFKATQVKTIQQLVTLHFPVDGLYTGKRIIGLVPRTPLMSTISSRPIDGHRCSVCIYSNGQELLQSVGRQWNAIAHQWTCLNDGSAITLSRVTFKKWQFNFTLHLPGLFVWYKI